MQKRYIHLRELSEHIKGNFKVGDALPNQHILADKMGYDRITLRENLIRLQCFGFINIEHGKPTTYVNQL
ncbi:GntR family transcriptional regulator [Paraglaciecola sp.]|uniref:GntR family transcriptional regulator n=1 Tax=Paraglaciecola sp. TaxID=1920173 RepID=UPI003EF8B5B9